MSNNYYSNPAGAINPTHYAQYPLRGNPTEDPYAVPRFRLGAGVTSMAQFRGMSETEMLNGAQLESTPNLLTKERMDIGQQQSLRPQAYKDQSADTVDGLASFFAAGSRYKTRDAYTQNHISVSGIPGVVHMAVLDAKGQKIPHAPFSWGGRSYHCDAQGKFTILERQYFQNTVPPDPYPVPRIETLSIQCILYYAMLCVMCLYFVLTPPKCLLRSTRRTSERSTSRS